MARPKAPEPKSANLSIERIRAAIPKLDRRICDLESFDLSVVQGSSDPHVEALTKKVDGTLQEIFGHGSAEYNDYAIVSMDTLSFSFYETHSLEEIKENYQAEIRRSVIKLKSLKGLFEERISDTQPSAVVEANRNTPNLASKRIFIVHGHDEGIKETVARYLAKLELIPIILHEQPNQGKTIIEKFEAHSDVAFALVLMTPDDVGYPRNAPDKASPRARQNVVLEMGFFMGALGRSHVCVLYKEGVEVPSDYHGVAYVALDGGSLWKLQIAREIKSAGIDIDLNKAL